MAFDNSAAAPDTSVCKYSYKKCPNPRTIKRNGKLHTLCEYHRRKANALQQAYSRKKKKGGATKLDEYTELVVPTDIAKTWLDDIDFTRRVVVTYEDCQVLLDILGSPADFCL